MALPLAHWTMRPQTCWSTPPRTWFTYLLLAASKKPREGVCENGFPQKHLFPDDATPRSTMPSLGLDPHQLCPLTLSLRYTGTDFI